MDVELITIGDEITTGYNADTNSAVLARLLVPAGFHVKYITSVGDSIDDMEEAFRLALKRAGIVITTGGLGPTDDDLTKRAIVKVFKRNLIFHEDVLEDIKKRFAARGLEMPAINHNQALLPQGATLFPNKTGSALGICIAEQDRIFISLPGVPHEMEQIARDEVLPYLAGSQTKSPLSVVTLKTTGIFESKLAELIKPALKLEPGVKLAYLPSYRGVTLRIMATADDQSVAEEKAETLARALEKAIGKHVFGRGDDTLEGVVGQLLRDNDRTLSVAESCTGGQLGEVITSIAGSSAYFMGGVQAYSNKVKVNMLGVPLEIIDRHGAVSEECARAMADGCRDRFETDYALSITGIAGPDGGSDEKPVGTVYVAVSSMHSTKVKRFHLGTTRDIIRCRAVYSAIEMLRREILDID